jgi:uncharacterized protein YjdB
MKKFRNKAAAMGVVFALGASLMANTVGAAAAEPDGEAAEVIAETTDTAESDYEDDEIPYLENYQDYEEDDLTDEILSKERLYTGASRKIFKTDGTNGQMPDDEWEELKKICESKIGQTGIWCTDYVNTCFGWKSGIGQTATAPGWLLKNGYYEVGSKTDLTTGTDFTKDAESFIAKVRRGDILVFSDDAGNYKHIAIACVDDDGAVYLYEGGMNANREVRKDSIAYYLSGSQSDADGYADNMQIFRKETQKADSDADDADKDADTSDKTDKDDEDTDGKTEVVIAPMTVSYNTHIQNIGWQGSTSDSSTWKKDGEMGGTSGKGLRLEAITIKVDGEADLGIAYNTHIQNIGWQNSTSDSSTWKKDGEISGTSGKGYRLEAIQIKLTGEDADKYSVFYRVHAQNYGWLGWAKDGQISGTSGQGLRLEGIEIVVLPEGELPDGLIGYTYVELGKKADNTELAGMVNYMTHVQNYGDQSYVYDGSVSGTSGEGLRLEGIRIKLNDELTGESGGIRYLTHVQDYGWQGDQNDSSTWKKDGEFSGTSGEGKRLEAIQLELYGDVAESYDIYYRVHVQNFGWLDWAKNGAVSGTTGYGYRLEGIQIVLVPKDSSAPGETTRTYVIK